MKLINADIVFFNRPANTGSNSSGMGRITATALGIEGTRSYIPLPAYFPTPKTSRFPTRCPCARLAGWRMLHMFPQSWYRLFSLIGGCCGLFACATGPDVDLVLHTSQAGSVSLERFHGRSFQAAHPVRLAPETIERVLRGLRIKPTQRALQTLIVGEPEAIRVFADEDVSYLAPLLAEGLARAASDQQVGFRVSTISPTMDSSEPVPQYAPGESVSGSLYAYGRSLYLTLTRVRQQKERGDSPRRPERGLPDATGLSNHVVSFVPSSALRPDTYRDARSTNATVIIDYEMLAYLPAETAPSPAGMAPLNGGTEPAKSPPPTRDAEIEALRQEIREIKKKLAEQESAQPGGRLKDPIIPR